MNIFKAKIFQSRKIRTDIFVTFSALIFISVICEIFYSSEANKDIILRFEKEHYSKKISSMTANWLCSYFSQVELLVSILSKNKILPSNDVQVNNGSDFADFSDLFKEALKKTSFTLTIQAALNDGSLLQVRNTRGLRSFQTNSKTPLPSYATNAIRKMEYSPDGDHMIETWEYMGEDFTPIVKETLEFAQYDPRERDWYVEIATNKKLLWSAPYKLKTSKVFGITVSSPIFNEVEKNIRGVISIDFSLNDFGDLLEKVKTTKNSSVRLITDKNEILASTFNREQALLKDTHLTSLMKVMDSDDEILQTAAKNLLGTNDEHTTYQLKNGKTFVASKQKLEGMPFSLLTITPQSDFTNDFNNIRTNMFFLSFIVFGLSVWIIFWLSRSISRPIMQLCQSAIAIGKMDLDHYPKLPKSNIFEVKMLLSAIDSMQSSIIAFSKYTPKGIVHEVIKSGADARIGGMTQEVTMFFSDIEKFSTVSEKLPAEYLIFHLSEYFDELTQNIMKHNGMIDKYIGDSIMAIWGAQHPDENHVIGACEAALECQKLLDGLTEKWISLGKPPLPTRIGLHTGAAIIGNIGSHDRMNFTAIGTTVDIASGLEGTNKIYGTRILASEAVENKARDKILFRVVDKIAFSEGQAGITIFEPVCSLKNANDKYYKLMDLCSKSREAFELYQSENFEEALKLYTEISNTFPEKKQSFDVLIERCKDFINNPPKNWDGIHKLW